jgi:hypothetical protein
VSSSNSVSKDMMLCCFGDDTLEIIMLAQSKSLIVASRWCLKHQVCHDA